MKNRYTLLRKPLFSPSTAHSSLSTGGFSLLLFTLATVIGCCLLGVGFTRADAADRFAQLEKQFTETRDLEETTADARNVGAEEEQIAFAVTNITKTHRLKNLYDEKCSLRRLLDCCNAGSDGAGNCGAEMLVA